MFNDVGFVDLILSGFYLRVIFISIAIIASIKIIGSDKILFLKKYIDKSFFSIEKIIYWLIAFLSIVYFKSLVEQANGAFLTQVFNEHIIFASMIFIALSIVLFDAFFYMLGSVSSAREIKNEITQAKIIKQVSSLGSVASFFLPVGVWAKFALFGGSSILNIYVDKEIKNNLFQKIKDTINSILKIACINLFIILGTMYVV